MVRPHVLLCGVDKWQRFEEFWGAGFSVDRCETEYDLVRWLLYGKATDLICVLEAPDRPVDEASMALVKTYTDVPLVLFRVAGHVGRSGLWSLEVLPGTPSRVWLLSIEQLLTRRRATGEAGPVQ